MYNKVLEQIEKHQTIIIHRHSKPDGDALGSQLGLKEAILASYPTHSVYAVGDMTARYSFMGEMDVISDEVYKGALVFIVDCPETEMISDNRYKLADYIIKIDHHILKEEYGNMEFISTSHESCCRYVFEIIEAMGLKLTNEGAKALYTGMVTDSGRFRYSSTTSETFISAAKMLKYDFNICDVYNSLYLDELDMCVLRAKYVLKMKLTKQGNVAYIITTKEELNATGADIFTISRGMVNTMSGIRGIDIWANFTETENGKVLVEIRSSKANVNQVAVKYGGGGHLNASGATIDSLSMIYNVLSDLDLVARGVDINV